MNETLVERMKRVRKEKKLTMFELALRLRVPEGMISRLEKGKVPPTSQQADIIRAFLAGKI
ncbi:MAG TPA: helix-turn-helix transcriptional regulator [Verrucomicrobiae bacterium]|jgi:transcriptional regulator with XRE-family HTH domain|nr:helix-turn-helix transcriptional regulator [Verrucomicrobiae bacterium]